MTHHSPALLSPETRDCDILSIFEATQAKLQVSGSFQGSSRLIALVEEGGACQVSGRSRPYARAYARGAEEGGRCRWAAFTENAT
jgi:hypothetical protein